MSDEKVLHVDLDALVSDAVDKALIECPDLASRMADEMIVNMFGERMLHHPAVQELRKRVEVKIDVRGILTRRIRTELCATWLKQNPQLQAQLDELRASSDAPVAEEEP